jgi:predicted enzyme related to lactoylglutathione lyase
MILEAAFSLKSNQVIYSLHFNNSIMGTLTYSKIKNMSPQLLVADINRSVEFYQKQLGFNLDFRHEDFYAGISKDGFSIHLKTGNPSMEERRNKRKNEDIDIMFSVDNVKDLYEQFNRKSVEVIQPLRKMDYGNEFYILDPDGYIIAFLEEVPDVRS